MTEIFGVPMSGIMTVLVVLLVLCLLSVAWVALRRPVIFKLGMRNIPRRKAQTILIVVGLMLSTLIISAALGTGDSLHYSLTKDSYQTLGEVDQLIVPSHEFIAPNADTSETFDAAILGTVAGVLENDASVDGVMPILTTRISATDETSQQSEPALVLTGADPSRLYQFGGLKSVAGDTID